MVVAIDIPVAGPYSGNDVTDTFNFTFLAAAEGDIVVTLTDVDGVETELTLTTDYIVTPSAGSYPSAGSVTLTTPPATGEKLTVSRETDINQLVDLQNRKGVNPETLETAYDRLTLITQEISERLGRAIKFPISGGVSDIDLPTPDGDKFIGWNTAGTELENKTPNTGDFLTTPVGSVDNTIVRFDGTGGAAFQGSGITIDDTDNLGVPGDIIITAASPKVQFADGTENADIALQGGNLRIKVDSDDVEAVSRIQFYIDNGIVGSFDSDGSFKVGPGIPSASVDFGDQTGGMRIPSGTTAERPAAPATGELRWNSTNSAFEQWTGSVWATVGGAGAFAGNGADNGFPTGTEDIFRVHDQTLTADVTIDTTENALAAGPLEIDTGVTLTVDGNLSIV